jgi:hypothetical protein
VEEAELLKRVREAGVTLAGGKTLLFPFLIVN